MAAQVFAIAVAIVIAGWLWFYIVRPILEDFGVIRVFNMSSVGETRSQTADIEAVYIPVSDMSIPVVRRPDNDLEIIEWLADCRKPDNKFRFSANQIYTIIGGDRNTVMRQIKEFRDDKSEAVYLQPDGTTGPATYPMSGRKVA